MQNSCVMVVVFCQDNVKGWVSGEKGKCQNKMLKLWVTEVSFSNNAANQRKILALLLWCLLSWPVGTLSQKLRASWLLFVFTGEVCVGLFVFCLKASNIRAHMSFNCRTAKFDNIFKRFGWETFNLASDKNEKELSFNMLYNISSKLPWKYY